MRDPLYGVRFAGGSDWGGLGAAFRELGWPVTARIRHETSIGFFSLTEAPGASPPDDVMQRASIFGLFSPSLQHSAAGLDGQSDAILLSIQPDVGTPLVRHRLTGRRFVLHDQRNWTDEEQAWRRKAFERLPPITPEAAMADLLQVVARLHDHADVPVLVANMSAAVPGDTMHAYLGMPETLSQRIRRFNLCLVDTAQAADFSIIDIDRITATGGAERLLIDPLHFTLEGCRRVALEVARILEDRGVIEL